MESKEIVGRRDNSRPADVIPRIFDHCSPLALYFVLIRTEN
jgi:hypothetical protein